MKFLCVKCDMSMRLKDTQFHEALGSLSVVFRCPQCTYECAMLTNAGETQLVTSLGINIGVDSGGQTERKEVPAMSKCPFSNALAGTFSGEHSLANSSDTKESMITWTAEASRRLSSIPEFVRPMAKMGIEKFAKDRGLEQITEAVLEEARGMFGIA